MNFSSQDAAQTLLSLGSDRGSVLGLGSDQRLGLGLGLALGTPEAEASVRASALDWVSDTDQTVFINTNQSDDLPFNNTRDDYDW